MAPAIVGNLSPADGEPLFGVSEWGMVGVRDESTSNMGAHVPVYQLKMMLRKTRIEGMFATRNIQSKHVI